MGWIRGTGRFVMNEGANIAGAEHIRIGSRLIKSNWSRLRAHVCPACNEGRLFPFQEKIDGKRRDFRGCNMCDHYQAVNVQADPDSLKRLRSLAQEKVAAMDVAELSGIIRRFQVISRIFYGMALATMLFAGYVIVFDHTSVLFSNSSRTFVCVLLISVWMFVQGLSASYRFWQTREQHFFVPGSFRKWIGMGQWLV